MMNKLETTIKIEGIGIPGVTAEQLQRTDNYAIYKRSDGPLEVFRIQVREEEEIFGRNYPTREVYPGNDDFGVTAWCFNRQENAFKKFGELSGPFYIRPGLIEDFVNSQVGMDPEIGAALNDFTEQLGDNKPTKDRF